MYILYIDVYIYIIMSNDQKPGFLLYIGIILPPLHWDVHQPYKSIGIVEYYKGSEPRSYGSIQIVPELPSSRLPYPHPTYASVHTLPKTNIAPENWWLEDHCPFWECPFSGAMSVLGG